MTRGVRRVTGLLALAVPGGFFVFFSLLSRTFDYPAIMDEPAATVLVRVAEGGNGLVALWGGATAAALLLVPLVTLLHRVLSPDGPAWLIFATTAGVLAAVFTIVDLGQWVFVVPGLAEAWAAADASAPTRAAVIVTFDAFHAWVGMLIGLVLATLFSGIWTVLTGLAMRSARPFRPWVGNIGVGAGAVLLASVLQPGGFRVWALLNTVGFGLWSVWLVLAGIQLWRYEGDPDLD